MADCTHPHFLDSVCSSCGLDLNADDQAPEPIPCPKCGGTPTYREGAQLWPCDHCGEQVCSDCMSGSSSTCSDCRYEEESAELEQEERGLQYDERMFLLDGDGEEDWS